MSGDKQEGLVLFLSLHAMGNMYVCLEFVTKHER